MENLKQCPFCNGNGILHQSYSQKMRKYFVFVKCDLCGAQGKAYTADREDEPAANEWDTVECDKAVTAWNTRTEEREGYIYD